MPSLQSAPGGQQEDMEDHPHTEIGALSLLKEILHSRTHFKVHLCAELFLLKLVPSVNDIVSDFLIAAAYSLSQDPLVMTWITFYSYFAICLPGIFLTFSLFHSCLKNHRTMLSLVFLMLLGTIVLVVSLSFLYSWPPTLHPQLMLFPAAVVATVLLSIKTLAVLVHGPAIQRLARLVTAYEGRCECLCQLIIIIPIPITVSVTVTIITVTVTTVTVTITVSVTVTVTVTSPLPSPSGTNVASPTNEDGILDCPEQIRLTEI